MKQLRLMAFLGLLVGCNGQIEGEDAHTAATTASALDIVTAFDTGCLGAGCEPGAAIVHQCLAANVTGCHVLSAGYEPCRAGLVPAATSLLARANLGVAGTTWCELPPGPLGCDATTTGGFCETTPEASRCRSTDTTAIALSADRFSASSTVYIACEVATKP